MKPILSNKLYLPDSISDYDKSNLTLYLNDEFIQLYSVLKIRGYKYYAVPRYYKNVINYIDKRTNGEDITISMRKNYKPRSEEQVTAIDKLLRSENGILAARVGFGKTFVAVSAITKLKKKTLVIVHKLPLIEQWREKIKEYTGLNDIGIIQASDVDLDKPIVIASVQSIVSKIKHDPEFIQKMYDANFGITFYDECHITTGAAAFNKSTYTVFSRRLYGLSATPYRSDGADKLIYYFIGPRIYINLDIDIPIHVVTVDLPVDVSKSRRYIMWGGKFNKQRYIAKLVKNAAYIESLAAIIKTLYKKGRNILLLSDRIKLIEHLYRELHNEVDVVQIHASVADKDFNHRVILATTGLFREGIDIPHLDTIIYGTPLSAKVGLTQSLGRVARQHSNKKYILVIDINNSKFDITKFMYKRRKRIYESLGANVIESDGWFERDIDRLEKMYSGGD